MSSAIDPELCQNTGRILTEWFEFPEYDDDQLRAKAREEAGVSPDYKLIWASDPNASQEHVELTAKINNFVGKRKRTRFAGGMTNVEVQHRLNEASKMVEPDNYKFLDDATRERTGLEINPLWMMECLVRSGVLSAKESVGALKELAQYTHSKAPNISHSTNTQMKPEDWLMELAKEEYKEVPSYKTQPKQPVEFGAGRDYESNMKKKVRAAKMVEQAGLEGLEELEAELGEWEDPLNDG